MVKRIAIFHLSCLPKCICKNSLNIIQPQYISLCCAWYIFDEYTLNPNLMIEIFPRNFDLHINA